MIELKEVSKWYGDVQVLNNCSTNIQKGEVSAKRVFDVLDADYHIKEVKDAKEINQEQACHQAAGSDFIEKDACPASPLAQQMIDCPHIKVLTEEIGQGTEEAQGHKHAEDFEDFQEDTLSLRLNILNKIREDTDNQGQYGDRNPSCFFF